MTLSIEISPEALFRLMVKCGHFQLYAILLLDYFLSAMVVNGPCPYIAHLMDTYFRIG